MREGVRHFPAVSPIEDGVSYLSPSHDREQTAEMSGWWPRGRWRSSSRGHLREQLVVLAGLVAFVGAVYVAIVIVVGLFVGRSLSLIHI